MLRVCYARATAHFIMFVGRTTARFEILVARALGPFGRLMVGSLLASGCFGSHDVLNGDLSGASSLDDLGPSRTQQPLTYFHDVKPLIDAKCTQCHFEGGIGHFSLRSYDDIRSLAKVVRAAVASGKMPPWRATGPLDQYIGDRRLTEEQKAIITGWIDQGAQPGNEAEAPPPVASVLRSLPRIDTTLTSPPYTPLLNPPDNYRCFVLDWPYAQAKYITGLGIEPGRTDLVHHAIAYLIPPEGVEATRQRDLAEEGPGYDCYSAVQPNLTVWLTSYEPGGYAHENPGGLGFEVRPGSAIVLQVHYNTLTAQGEDTSKLQLMVADQVSRVGHVSLILNQLWPVGFMPIPANQPDVLQTWQGRPSALTANASYDLFWVDLHMHTLGRSGSIGIVRSGSTVREPLLEIPDWAFEWQETYRLRQPAHLNPGDQLYVDCHFDNTEAHQAIVNGERLPVRDVNWGENTTDEMCLGNVLAAPAVN